MLKRLDDLSEFHWISQSLWPLGSREDGGNGHTLRHLLPDVFESYCKVLHPIYRDESIDDKRRPWRVRDAFSNSDLAQITWRALADEYGVPYHRQISANAFTRVFAGRWPRYLVAPDEGTLDSPLLETLGQILSKHTSSSRWYFEYFIDATGELSSDEIYVGNPSDLATANDQAGCGAGPTYWWPADRAWCVCTDYDLSFTVVASTRTAYQDIVDTDTFEAVEMQRSDRIDDESHTDYL